MTNLLPLRAVAARLHSSDRQVRRYCADEHDPLPVVRLGPRSRRVSVVDLEAWLSRRRAVASPAVEPGLFAGFSDEAQRALAALFPGEVHRECTAEPKTPSGTTSDRLIDTQQPAQIAHPVPADCTPTTPQEGSR